MSCSQRLPIDNTTIDNILRVMTTKQTETLSSEMDNLHELPMCRCNPLCSDSYDYLKKHVTESWGDLSEMMDDHHFMNRVSDILEKSRREKVTNNWPTYNLKRNNRKRRQTKTRKCV
jgi:Transposase